MKIIIDDFEIEIKGKTQTEQPNFIETLLTLASTPAMQGILDSLISKSETLLEDQIPQQETEIEQ